MADDNSKNKITNKNGTKLVRDENGKIVSGVLNPNGRPKKGLTLTDIAREILEEELPDGKTRKEVLMRKIATLAYEGNETMIKLIWNYIDGMPTQRQEVTGADGQAFTLTLKDYAFGGKLEKAVDDNGDGQDNTENANPQTMQEV